MSTVNAVTDNWYGWFYTACTCPPVWHGVIPPSCLVHNPPHPLATWTTTTNNTADFVVNTATKRRKRRKKGKR